MGIALEEETITERKENDRRLRPRQAYKKEQRPEILKVRRNRRKGETETGAQSKSRTEETHT